MEEETKQMAKEEAEAEELKEFMRKMSSEEKGVDNFFLEIIRAEDTRKVSYLTEDELGHPTLPVRTLFELADDCALVPSLSSFETDFRNQAENILSTALSKQGFLIKARITQKKEFLDKEKKKARRGLFGKKEKEVIE